MGNREENASESETEILSPWRAEILNRIDDLDSGREEGIPAAEVFRAIREEFGWK